MRNSLSLEQLDKAINQLTVKEQLEVLKKVISRLQKKSPKKELDWKKLYGVGKGLWQGLDAQKYVNQSRNDR